MFIVKCPWALETRYINKRIVIIIITNICWIHERFSIFGVENVFFFLEVVTSDIIYKLIIFTVINIVIIEYFHELDVHFRHLQFSLKPVG